MTLTHAETDAMLLERFGIARSPKWEAFARAFLFAHPQCLVCGRANIHPNVHHKYPVSYIIPLGRPDLELDERNTFTLCADPIEQHHLLVGHLDSYLSYNPHLEHFIALSRGLLSVQIRSMREWIDAVRMRPKPYHEMNDQERRALRIEIDRLMPRA